MTMSAKTPWAKAGLPGRPVFEEANGSAGSEAHPNRIIKGRDGKPLYFQDALDARYVVDADGEFLGREYRRVFFLSANGDRLKQCAVAAAGSTPATVTEALVVEAFAWMRQRERGQRREKRRVKAPR